jgi:hypothetical protein
VKGKEPSLAKLWLPYLLDIVGPFVAYLIVHAFGGRAIWALTVGGAVAGASTLVNSIRRKGLDAVGGLVLLEIAASIALLAFVRDARLLLIRPSVYTGVAAIYVMSSAFAGRPLSYAGSRPMAARGGPARLAAYERAWERSAAFRHTHRMVTFALGLGFAVDAVLRVLIVYTAPLERAAWLSNVPHAAAIVLMAASCALAGRRFSRLVDEQTDAMP